MSLYNIAEKVREKEELIALTLAASLLTHEQIKILAHICAGNPADVVAGVMMRTQGERGMRGGPLLPYLVGGTLEEFPSYVNDVVSLLLGMYSGGGDLASQASNVVLGAANAAVGNGRAVSVGSAAFYADKGGNSWANPFGLRKAGASVPIMSLYSVQGISENMLGTGMNGMTPIKGNLPDNAKPQSMGLTAARAVAQDPALAAAANAAADMERVK